jgi:hypothetical protein
VQYPTFDDGAFDRQYPFENFVHRQKALEMLSSNVLGEVLESDLNGLWRPAKDCLYLSSDFILGFGAVNFHWA